MVESGDKSNEKKANSFHINSFFTIFTPNILKDYQMGANKCNILLLNKSDLHPVQQDAGHFY